jgi:2-haloacid dehalogenase
MNKYKILLFDLDDTLFDFSKSQYIGIKHIMENFNLEFNEDHFDHYLSINKKYWDLFEHNQIDSNSLRSMRFEEFFSFYNIKVNGQEVDNMYRNYLDKSCHLLPGTLSLLKKLYVEYDLYAATNGVSQTQMSRLDECNIKNFFIDIFISEDIGYNKPDKEFFEYCSKNIANFDKNIVLMIGDSLTSDIQGAINFSIDSCWFNAK